MSEEFDGAGTTATANLLASTLTRRSMLLKAGAASGGLAVAGGLFGALKAEAAQSSILSEPSEVTPYLTIFKVAQSAEQLAITLYRNGVANASKLGLSAQELNYFKAAGIEEQIHQKFFAGITGVAVQPAATHFSFPHGHDTFTDLKLFITAQQQLEGVFDTAFLAAVRELSHLGAHRAAQIAAQIATVESEHRVLGVQVAQAHGITELPNTHDSLPTSDPNPLDKASMVPTDPPDIMAFTPVFVDAVPDAVKLAKAAGYLSPRPGNDFKYEAINFNDPTYAPVAAKILFTQPYIQLGGVPGA